MATSTSPKRSSNAKCHVRSISLPSRSHPASLKLVEELNKLRTGSRSASGSARAGLVALEELYEAVYDFLAVPSTQQAISSNQAEPCVDELLDGSVRLLDAFAVTRDLVSRIKDQARGVQSAIRRRNPDSSNIEAAVAEFARMKKKSRRDIKGMVMGLKRIEERFGETLAVADNDRDFCLAMTVMREVVASSASTLQALLSSLDNSKKSKWRIMAKFVHKGAIAIASDEIVIGNEFEALDDVMSCLSKDVLSIEKAKMKMTQDQLRDLEIGIGGIEDELDGLYRRLIRTRASLLNIISSQ